MAHPDSDAPGSAQTLAPIRVTLVDDSFLIREGLRQLLALSTAVDVVDSCVDADSALASIRARRPDVVITDIRMPPTFTDEGIRLAESLHQLAPEVGVVVLSQEGHVELAAQLLQSGAAGRGYLLKDRIHDLEQLESTILAVSAGECRIDPILVEQLVQARSPSRSALAALTPRQRQLLEDVAEGKSNTAIARERYLSLRAVEKHVSEIFTRLGISSDPTVSRRVAATLMYLRETTP